MWQYREVLHLDKITIYSADMESRVVLPRVKDIQVGAEEVANKVTMASGKVVKDMVGYRTTVQAAWDYLPASTLSALAVLLRSGGFFYVEHPSPSGDMSGFYEITYPAMSVFAFKDGVAVWHNVKLKMTAQEVIQ